jgi:hypothetical protein
MEAAAEAQVRVRRELGEAFRRIQDGEQQSRGSASRPERSG